MDKMQVKPRFEVYKIIEQYTFLKDDTNNEICLTLLEVKLPNSKMEVIESSYKFWTVIGKNQQIWNNKSVSYESVAYWKSSNKVLFKDIVNGFLVEEKENGTHNLFSQSGARTTFTINRI